jgi:hypothetical protein
MKNLFRNERDEMASTVAKIEQKDVDRTMVLGAMHNLV